MLFSSPSSQNVFSWPRETLIIHSVRYASLLPIALIIAHFVSLNQLPFTAGYHFPFQAFMVILAFGAFICTANWMIFQRFPIRTFSSTAHRLTKRLTLVLVSTVFFYSLIYTVVVLGWFGSSFSWLHYLKFLVICAFMMAFEFAWLEVLRMRKPGKQPFASQMSDQLYIPTMTREVKLSFPQIDVLQSMGGVVTLFSREFNPLITRYSSLEEIEKVLPRELFYRVNRQYLVNRDTIRSVKKNPNRTLELVLQASNGRSPQGPIQISRYKRKDFLQWLKGQKKEGQ